MGATSIAAEATVTTELSLPELANAIEETEKLARRCAAESYAHGFRFLLTTMRQERPTFSPEELTPHFLQHVDKGKLLRKAAPSFAQLKGITDRKAAHFLHLAVNLIQHAPELINKLAAGQIPAEHVRVAGEKLKSVTPPNPSRDADGHPWDPEAYPQAVLDTDNAKDLLGARLTELAAPGIPEQDFTTEAARLRETHHPHNPTARHATALKRRYLRIGPARDGMSKLEALISSDDADQLVQRLRHRAKTASRQQGETRTIRQLEVDLLLEAVQNTAEQNTPSAGHDEPPTHKDTADSVIRVAEVQSPQPLLPGLDTGPQSPTLKPQNSNVCSCQQAGGHDRPQSGRNVMVYLNYSFEAWILSGGTIADGQLEFMKSYDPHLWEQAQRNRQYHLRAPASRSGSHPPGVNESGARATNIGTGQQLSPELSAALLPQAAMMQAIITHPATGYPIGLGKRARHPNRRVKDLLLYRDRHCRFPGCHVPGTDCEVDHVHDWVLSNTSELYGLALLCKQHHGGKTARWWQVEPKPELGDGVLEFTFNTGKKILTHPQQPLDPRAWADIRQQLETPPF
ncbi:HNH endonuclease signature motif containing protein [Micrococcoides hystricis]|uniref:HNH endonuclease signature motif containing protein n=1 Tax=Micrococcoides hystricis TaxID=1572761 RepID=A0ABV6PB79_9MICC